MTIAQQIENRVNSLAIDSVFSIADLGFPAEWWENVRVKLSRLANNGVITKIGKGRYYKPRKSVFGVIPPAAEELVKDLLIDDNGKADGYLTGYALWQKMGLTTQISNIIEISTNKRHNPLKRGHYTVRFVMQANRITKDNIPLLQILDAVKSIKQIPDTTVEASVIRIKDIVSGLGERKIQNLATLSLQYAPRVRALIGALLDGMGLQHLTGPLLKSQNPSTRYKLGDISERILPYKQKWNIE